MAGRGSWPRIVAPPVGVACGWALLMVTLRCTSPCAVSSLLAPDFPQCLLISLSDRERLAGPGPRAGDGLQMEPDLNAAVRCALPSSSVGDGHGGESSVSLTGHRAPRHVVRRCSECLVGEAVSGRDWHLDPQPECSRLPFARGWAPSNR